MSKAAFNNKKLLITSKKNLYLRKKLAKCCIWSLALYHDETWKLWKVDQKYLESFEMWCWDNQLDWLREKLLQSVKDRNILQSVRRRKANCIGQILHRKYLLKHVIEVKMEERLEVTGKKGRRCKQLLNDLLLDDLNEKKEYRKLNKEAHDRTLFTLKRVWTYCNRQQN
jgi:hypothetical protein